ncbi:MAG: P-loop NTPase [Treponemataceae bacterium]
MQIIPIASGKGGVGKSLLAANLSIALAKLGKKVILVDLDIGSSNLHLVLGQKKSRQGLGTYLIGNSTFDEIILETDYDNLLFIQGDSEIPCLTAMKATVKNDLIRKFQSSKCDFLILDLGAGSHINILDFFLLSPHGIIVATPSVTSALNAYLFLKNVMFRLMVNSFKRGSHASNYLDLLKTDAKTMQSLYIPKFIEQITEIDPVSADMLKKRLMQLQPCLILNMISDPKDAEKAHKVRRSCKEYLSLNLQHLGVLYLDNMQDVALSSRLPIVVYKPQSILSKEIFHIAQKIIKRSDLIKPNDFSSFAAVSEDSFSEAEEQATLDFESRMTYIEELLGSGAFTQGDLGEVIKTQHYEILQLKKENTFLKSKIIKQSAREAKL